MRRVFSFLCLLALLTISATAASIAIDQNMFGHLDQADVNSCTSQTGVNNSCGPTSFVNSLVYLENRWPGTYPAGTLIPTSQGNAHDNQVLAADIAACYMGCDGNAGGTTIANFISGKAAYFNQMAPGSTIIENMNVYANGIWPTFDFMYQMLAMGEDVELLVGFYNINTPTVRSFGHYITLTGVSFGIPFATGNGTMNFVDPNGGTNFNNIGLSTFSGAGPFSGAIYDNQTYVNGYYVAIEAAVAESPIPEPGTWVFLIVAIPALAMARRRFARQ
jgi:hypothetical protein